MQHSEEKMTIIQGKNLPLLHEEMKVGPLVAETPAYAKVFEMVGIDYCCKGKKTLKELCDEKKLDVADVLEKLKTLPASSENADWKKLSSLELIAHIKEKHHEYLRKELPRLSHLMAKVAGKHSSSNPELLELQSIFERFKSELLEHVEQEDAQIFPLVEKFLTSRALSEELQLELKEHLHSLEDEHSKSGADLERMNELTNGYTPPKRACTTYLVLFNSLSFLEKDIHEHIHKENHVLFPQVLNFLSSI